MDYTFSYNSPLGTITLASDGNALIGLWFDGQKYFAETLSAEHREMRLPIFAQTVEWLDQYFSGKVPVFTPALNLQTTPFRKDVWEFLLTIPYGQTISYGQLAERLAAQRGMTAGSARAVGGAVEHNPISLIIPCHRVVGADGRLTGYAGGIDRKRKLLELEGTERKNRSTSL